MTQFTGFWLTVYYVLIYATLFAAVMFAVGYGLLMRWWKREEGKHLFFYSLAIADAFVLIGARPILGDFPGRPVLTMFCLLSLCFVIWWRLVLFVKSYFKNRPHNRALGLVQNGEHTREENDGMD